MKPLKKNDPESIGGYTLIGVLGDGGMGKVYLAAKASHSYAIKVLKAEAVANSDARTRLTREVEILKRIKHPNVVEFIDVDLDDENPWIAMEFVNGPNLKEWVEDRGVLKPDVWENTARCLLSALNAIHAAGVTHRDIKPANILMTNNGPIIIDFGIAFESDATALTMTGVTAGSPGWMSPEQFDSGDVTSKSDIFSLASTLYFAATGISPWGEDATSVSVSMRRILFESPNLKKASEPQQALLKPMLEKNPKDRVSAEQAIKLLRETPTLDSVYVESKKDKTVKVKKVKEPKAPKLKKTQPQPEPVAPSEKQTRLFQRKSPDVLSVATQILEESPKPAVKPAKSETKTEVLVAKPKPAKTDLTEFIPKNQEKPEVRKPIPGKRVVIAALTALTVIVGLTVSFSFAFSNELFVSKGSSKPPKSSGFATPSATGLPASTEKSTNEPTVPTLTPSGSKSASNPASSKASSSAISTARPKATASKSAQPTQNLYTITSGGQCHDIWSDVKLEMRVSSGKWVTVPGTESTLIRNEWVGCPSNIYTTVKVFADAEPGTIVRWHVTAGDDSWSYLTWAYSLGDTPLVRIQGGKLFRNGVLARTDGSGVWYD